VLGINGNKDKLVDDLDLKFADDASSVLGHAVKIMQDPRRTPENPGPSFEDFRTAMKATQDRGDFYFDKFVVGKNIEEMVQDSEKPIPYFFRLLARGEVSEEEAKKELVGLLFAGVDTTHHVFLWILYQLGRYPEKQEILRKELVSVMGDGPLESKHLKSLSYLNQVIRETHRLTPIGPTFTSRRFLDGAVIGGYDIPKGTKVTFQTFSVQNDPLYVDNPKEFLPERWTPEAVAERKGTAKEVLDHKLLTKPFGFGQRMCVGARVAELELKASIARIVRDWRFEWSPKEQDHKIIIGTGLRASPYPTFSWSPAK